ncbi:MAG: hypothetical protein ACKVTZ_06900 [Bacteroidia bacterium]
MAEPTLSLLRNTFNNVTKSNYKRMLLMARDHKDKLAGVAMTNPLVDTLYQRFLPAYTAFSTLYDSVNSNYSLYQGYTQQFENYIENLRSTLIRKWDVLIQVEYDQPTFEYTMLLPNGRSVFQTGAYELRLSAVNQLYNNLVAINNPNLSGLITTIDTWRNAAQAARTKQQQVEHDDKMLRKQLEDARSELAIEMYGVFYGLAAIYYRDPIQVEMYYELKYLRNTTTSSTNNNNTVSNTVNANSQKTVLTGNYTAIDGFEITNNGTVDLRLWITNNESNTIPIDAPTINAGDTLDFFADELSDGTIPLKYVIATNENGIEGKVIVKKLE